MKYQIHPEVLVKKSLDEDFLLHLNQGVYFSLDKDSAEIFKMLSQNKSAHDIAKHVAAEAIADESEVKNDIEDFLNDLIKNEILVPAK